MYSPNNAQTLPIRRADQLKGLKYIINDCSPPLLDHCTLRCRPFAVLTATARPLFRKTKASLSFIRTFLQPHSIIFIDVHSTFHKFQVVASVSNTTGARGARFLALLHVGTSS
ncbi:hypothetical protein CYMTET_17114 [Cymbomonas tetramitiformis]|uniref:Uncharacterized protein n=1 Tax=Cymbomonas tetramitiformis TaxID=36881 RepID=A0AAE0GB91_9CHLO|nr:hypothetical protein CYMTET_17114 [Cymbomonas tetramitiformis]